MRRTLAPSLIVVALLSGLVVSAESFLPKTYRETRTDTDLRLWLENMVWHHGYNDAEVMEATGLTMKQVAEAKLRLNIQPNNKPARPADAPLLVLPYPGGRHPRTGFQDGAIWPQRETKVSVFTPWDDTGYVVVDVPEALWSNLGLTYLAHSHVPTIWDTQGVTLEPLEWNRGEGGVLDITRKLPNAIAFTTKVTPQKDAVRFEMTLTNGTPEKLSDLRVQMCAMLKMAKGFNTQTNDNKRFEAPYAAVRSDDGKRWIILAFDPCHRAWGNDPCPCLHSDPKFPDCEPGQTEKIVGRLSFYEGEEIEAELKRIDGTGWREAVK